ncbi:MAG: hypothetical protein KME59_21515 [Trichormus sp. ATA11-4-KO1]|jgi:hypothetical protein|nr:hypothetical protein [Trichormus sp. ATA11-4-KO1]
MVNSLVKPRVPTDAQMTVIVDTSVFLHSLEEKHVILNHKNPHWTALIKAQLQWLVSGDWLDDLKPNKLQFIFVTDSKPYWRTEYLLSSDVVSKVPRKKKAEEYKRVRLLELLAKDDRDSEEVLKLTEDLAIHYKAGRKFPTYEFTKVKRLLFKYLTDQGYTQIGKVGYEADDVAACVVKVNQGLDNPNRLVLLTIDSDWMGLVNDDTAWFCMHGWTPRMRSDRFSCDQWALRRLGSTLDAYTDIWDIKGVKGDKSDNLPASDGVLLPVIDLLNPPDEHKLWNTPMADDIRDVLEHPRNRRYDGSAAMQYIQACGVAPCVRALNIQKDFAV